MKIIKSGIIFKIIKSVIIVGMVSMSGQAFAYCRAPSPPSAPSSYSKPNKPNVPYCINERANTNTCSDTQIRSYNGQVEQYNRKVQQYVSKLRVYAAQATSFANKAQDYANCEIKETN